MTITVLITAEGKVTLCEEVLNHLGAQPGDRLDVELLPSGRIEIRAKPRLPAPSVFGLLQRPGEQVRTIEEIAEAGPELKFC
jgi:hypothetical protein